MLLEGGPPERVETVESRRYLPHALVATLAVIVLPALVVIPLVPLDGIAGVILAAVLATGLSAVAGSIGTALWARRPESRDIAFGDLMLWSWIRRVRAERRLAEVTRVFGEGGLIPGLDSDPLLPALRRLSGVLDARDARRHGHTCRVTRHAERIARTMGLDPADVAKIRTAASVHDVGKVSMPRAVLANADNLTAEERALLERHAVEGAQMVAELGDAEVTAMVRHHHESFDGNGYPDGLAGEAIPIGARIIAVANSFDVLTSIGPHQGIRGHRSALDTLSEDAGSKLDPAVVSAFLGYYSGKRSIAGGALVAAAPQQAVRWLAATPAAIGGSVPPLAQGVCAAGAVAFAGACLAGSPSMTDGSKNDGATRAQDSAQRTAGTTQAGATSGGGSSADGRKGSGKERSAAPKNGSGGRDDSGPQGSQPGTNNAPAAPPSGSTPAPSGGGGGGGGSTPTPPSQTPQPVPDVDLPPVDVPELPSDPTDLVPQVLDSVPKILEALPVQELLDPVTRLLTPPTAP